MGTSHCRLVDLIGFRRRGPYHRAPRRQRPATIIMANSDYQAIPYRSKYKLRVAELLRGLWSDDPAENLTYFEWKYEDNPYTETPLGIVVLHDGNVVGYRGYFACRFEVRAQFPQE